MKTLSQLKADLAILDANIAEGKRLEELGFETASLYHISAVLRDGILKEIEGLNESDKFV